MKIGLKVTKVDVVISAVLFSAALLLPVFFTLTNQNIATIYVASALCVIGCWRLSYLRSKAK